MTILGILLLLLLHPRDGLFSRTTWVSWYQKGKTSLDLNEARDDRVLGCSGISWTICKQSQSINQSFLYWHMTKRICWHLIQNYNTRKVNTNLYTACRLRSFYRPSVLCDRAFVCHVSSAPCSIQITTPTPHHSIFTGQMLFLTPSQQCQSTEWTTNNNTTTTTV